MYDGDEYEDQLLGDPEQLDDLIEARDLNPGEDEQNDEDENGADVQDQDKGDESSKKDKPKRKVVLNPQPKLDAIRLTGPRGIATIEGLFRDFKFLGHGNEEQDLKRIMERLELWGNRLFPKFQFDDLLEKVEKLGQKRPVINFVNKIRMGIVNEDSVAEGPADEIDAVGMDLDVEPAEEGKATAMDDVFTQLIEQQLSQMESQQKQSTTPVPQTTITEEQRERMLQNRRLAEERRLARLMAQKQEEASAPPEGGESPQRVVPSDTDNHVEAVNVGFQSDKVEENSLNESTGGSDDVNTAVVSVCEGDNSVRMEISTSDVHKVEQICL